MTHPLLGRLQSSSSDERLSACRDAVDDPSAVLLLDALGETLGDPVREVALAASDALAKLARQIDGVKPAVQRALRSDNASRRWLAALTSARIEPPTPKLLPAIVDAFTSRDAELRWMAARVLVDTGRLNPEVLPLAIGLASAGESAEVRRMAIHCVRELGPERPESTRALVAGTRDPDRSVRRAALTALAALTDPSRAVFDRLLELIGDTSDASARAMAVHSICALARDGSRDLPQNAISALRRIAEADPSVDLRAAAGRALEPFDAAAATAE